MAKSALNLKPVNVYLDNAKTDAEIAKAYRALATSAEIKLDHLSDAQLAAIVKSIPGKGDDVDMERVQKAQEAEPEHHDDGEAGKDSLLPVEIGQSRNAFIAQLARAMDADPTMLANLAEIQTGNEAVKAAPVTILFDWYREHGAVDKDGWPTTEGIAKARAVIRAMPVAGTKKSDGVNNPDRYGVPYTVDGEEKTRQTTFYGELYDATAEGQALKLLINKIKATKTETADENPYSSWDDRDRTAEINRLSAKRNTVVNNFRSAARIEHQIEALDEMPGGTFLIKFVQDVDANGKVVPKLKRTKAPIIVRNNADDLGKAYSVGQFKSWKVKAAKAPTRQAMEDTVKKGTGTGTPLDGGAKATPPTTKVASTFMVSLRNGLDIDEWRATLVKELSRANSDVDLQNWYEVYQSLGYVFSTNHDLVKRATALQAETKETKAA